MSYHTWTELDNVSTYTRAELLAGMRPNLDARTEVRDYRNRLAAACKAELSSRSLESTWFNS